ncbi:hypothetical protein K1T71_009845 [Dendrolimus kikuchii]|uniref:Uncharacterized protein n=1 Tax=Dendrolimus kikuchii TaxID=765133 RepID=A0ACC1CT02_9NEOP|nr:hypothetical protein K1T71_009845 [Dendrolimus kikuchii]
MNSVVFDINGTKIGVIGYLTPDTKVLAMKNNVEYIEEVKAIKEEVVKLKQEGVNILIALGHSGFTKDLEIAKEVEDIDLVIGGHTNTFLWNGKVPDLENAEGPYPILVKQISGRKVPTVQAYAYTKYLGKLRLVFNTTGEIIRFDGNPIILGNSIPQDSEVLQIVNKYRSEVLKISEVVLGYTSVFLDGTSCRLKECNMGNLITDAMIYKYASEYKGDGWTDSSIAIIQGGGIRATISHPNIPANVTKGDLLTVMPFDGNMARVEIDGNGIWNMLEHAVESYNRLRAPGQFLQMSGLKVEYDFKNGAGRRVVKVLVRCGSLGNHEFDTGVGGLTPFIENLTCPVLAANLDLKKVPELSSEANLKKSVILDVAGQKIGIVGYLTPETKTLALPNDVEYIDEVTALRREVKNLQNQGINIIIALGHSGYVKDMEIAEQVDGVDLVIGGHTNTFLWNGTVPDREKSQGSYPTYVTQASGRRVPVVQAYAYTKYLGYLKIIFNSDGEIINLSGEPILLDNTVPQDQEILNIVEKYRSGILNTTAEVVGITSVVLDGQCQTNECNLGNMITDAMVFKYAISYNGEHWTDAPIAILQGGGIRTSIVHAKMPTNITKGDLLGVMPFDGTLVTKTMNGSVLLSMLEHSVAKYSTLDPPGRFLQYSGIRVVYNLKKPVGKRVVKATARCWACNIPKYSKIEHKDIYKSLGNHEFDEAVDGVIPFIRNLSSPVLAANLIMDNVPELKNEPNLHKAIIVIKNGVDIGIIGYLTPETKFLAPVNKVEYEDEVVALRREVNKLKNQGVNIIIALGHSGYIRDLEIAQEVEHLDLVIGGHSNTFLWNSNTTSETPEVPQDSYPSIVVQRSGRLVRVVQAYAYTKYMGKLHITFDSEGEIIASDGDPILLNQKIPKDPELLEIVEKYRKNVDRINSEIIGKSLITLNGDTICRLVECNIGNLITTAMLNYTKENFNDRYPDVNIAIVQGGRIRASIDRPTKPFDMTRGDWMTVLPFSDTLTIVTMNGSVLKESLEHSVSLWRKVDSVGQFLQFTGMKVIFDLSKPPGSRIVETKAVCSNCGNKPREIKDNYEYKIIMPTFLANAGDGYTMFKDLPGENLNYNELECVLEYIKKYSPIGTDITGRIKILNESTVKSSPRIHSTDQNSAAIRFAVNQVLNLMIILSICRYMWY